MEPVSVGGRRAGLLGLVAGGLGACGLIDGTDCRYFADCAPHVPRGQLCGLAHQADTGEAHLGSSCATAGGAWTDPAWRSAATGVVAARPGPGPCPDRAHAMSIDDHEASGRHVAACGEEGSGAAVPRRLDDVAEGTVCGLGVVGGTGTACEGVAPHEALACPPGYQLQWVPDVYIDAVDATCASTGSTLASAFEVVAFCARMAGGPHQVQELAPGAICGLHAATHVDSLLPYGTHSGPPDLAAELDRLFGADVCPDHPLRRHHETLRAAAAAPPRCLGVSVLDGCPAGLARHCTWDQVAVEALYFDNILPDAWCWCAAPEAGQGQRSPSHRAPP